MEYKIRLRFTCPYTGQRNGGDKDISNNLSLKQAHKLLLQMFNEYFEDKGIYAPNWGMAVIKSRKYIHCANPTHPNGLRSFSYDGRIFEIIEQ